MTFKRFSVCYFAKRFKNSYSHTVLLPKSSFPAKLGLKERNALDREFAESSQRVYELQLNDSKREKLKSFTLLDGPPYANGPAHIGHSINRLLKDFSVRFKASSGHSVTFSPGFDCHGLPIELLALKSHPADHDPLSIRSRATAFAAAAIADQQASFKSYNTLANWHKPYATYDRQYEARQLELFWALYQKGMVYRAEKPVFWSVSSGTALADSELEYRQDHVSTAVYYRCRVVGLDAGGEVYALVWTTTPWTLVLNDAICYAKDREYVVVRERGEGSGPLYIVAAESLPQAQQAFEHELQVVSKLALTPDLCYESPLDRTKRLPFYPSRHVDVSKGTGLVHTAYAHGLQDYQVARINNQPITCHINEQGCYSPDFPVPELRGQSVLAEGNETALRLLSSDIVLQYPYTHAYPYDWRTHKPVIIRASPQWFIATEAIKAEALRQLESNVVLHTDKTRGLSSTIESAPDWCISRQRVWGVPLPVFYANDGSPVINEAMIRHIITLVKQFGTDCWWQLPVEELLPKEFAGQQLVKGTDVLDVWFDSGAAWFCALDSSHLPVDLVLEGEDQFRGWFQSLLLTSVAAGGKAPYKNVVVHGFVVDQEGKKMSKSVGNVVRPQEIMSFKHKGNALGVDGLRLWAAYYGCNRSQIFIGEQIMKSVGEKLKDIRYILKFILGAIDDFEPSMVVPYEELQVVDKIMLLQLCDFMTECREAYESFAFDESASLTLDFINGPLSNFYCATVRDRLYCERADSTVRRAAQSTLLQVGQHLAIALWPLLPNLVLEVNRHYPLNTAQVPDWPTMPAQWSDDSIRAVAETVLEVRKLTMTQCAGELPEKQQAVIEANPEVYGVLSELQEQGGLVEVLRMAKVTVRETEGEMKVEVSKSELGWCERCRKSNRESDGSDLCARCEGVLSK